MTSTIREEDLLYSDTTRYIRDPMSEKGYKVSLVERGDNITVYSLEAVPVNKLLEEVGGYVYLWTAMTQGVLLASLKKLAYEECNDRYKKKDFLLFQDEVEDV